MGYSPMVPAIPVDKDDSAPLKGTQEDLKVAASQIAERRQQEMNPLEIERKYLQQEGANAGRPMDERLTVSAQQAASDLGLARRQEAAAAEAEVDKLLADAINQLHSSQVGAPEGPQKPQQQAQPQWLSGSPVR